MDELKEYFPGKRVIIDDNANHTLEMFTASTERKFMVLEATAKKNLNISDSNIVWNALTQFIKNTSEENPSYIIINISQMDAFTLAHIQNISNILKAHKQYIETRLMGSVIIVDEHISRDAYLISLFRNLYTTVRPICWWSKNGDVLDFVKEWESKIK